MLMTTPNSASAGDVTPLQAEPAASLYRLMTWLSPSFPVGAFSYSSGIEWAVEAGDIKDVAMLTDWLSVMLTDGAGFCDSVFLKFAHWAVVEHDATALAAVAELAAAYAPSRERHLETTAQGRAFIEIAKTTWHCEALDFFAQSYKGDVAYPIAVGVLSAGHGIELPSTLHAYLHALVSNWISAGVRLIPLGQTDGQRALLALEPHVVTTVQRARDASLDDLGGATFRADLASMRHETQYTRLFRS